MFNSKNPWDIAPIPLKGDATRDVTATAKGHATSTWEGLEVELSRLYAALTGNRSDDLAAMARYGEQMNFKDRLERLKKTGEEYFSRKNCQILEGDFQDIIRLATEFSVRRNEIVHSVIRAVIFERDYEPMEGGGHQWIFRHQFYLVPPTYTARKYDSASRPAFMYTSAEISAYEEWFTKISISAQNITLRLRDPSYPPFGRKHTQPVELV